MLALALLTGPTLGDCVMETNSAGIGTRSEKAYVVAKARCPVIQIIGDIREEKKKKYGVEQHI